MEDFKINHMMRKVEYRGRASTGGEAGYQALQSMLKGEYTEESTGARTIRQTGGKDRHSKVFTSKGPRDRRVRLSVATAIRFYDLQDRLGFEQPSKAVEWLLLHCQPSIQALPQLGSLQPMRVAAIPKAVYMDHPPPHHHNGKKNHDDQTTQYNRENQASHHINHTLHSLASYNDFHVQDSIEEDPPQSSNPSSSGASSDHPMQQLCETTWPDCKALSETQLIMPDRVQASLSLRQRPASPEFRHMNKRSRILQNPANSSPHQRSQADNYETFTPSGSADAIDLATMHPLNQQTNCSLAAVGRMLGINYSAIAPLNYSSVSSNRHITSLFINENNALHLNSNLQGQMNVGSQPSRMSWLPPSNHEPNQYVDITQTLLAAQVNHVVNNASINPHNVIQEACNISLFDRGEAHQACTPMINLSDTVQLNNKPGAMQQVEELLSNMYTSPSRSPSESTSINTIPGPEAASFSKPGSNIANIFYRPSWSTPLTAGLKQETHHDHSLL